MPSILVVDDSADLRETLAEILHEQGYRVRTAAHGQDALTQLRNGPLPSLILMDLVMPVMDGWELRRHLRQDPRLAPVPVVVISGSEGLESVDAVAHLRKPFPISDLLSVVKDRARAGEPDGDDAKAVIEREPVAMPWQATGIRACVGLARAI